MYVYIMYCFKWLRVGTPDLHEFLKYFNKFLSFFNKSGALRVGEKKYKNNVKKCNIIL